MVINVVSHRIVRQMALASIEYDAAVNEFDKAGFTPLPSDLIRPFRVAESPVHMECKVENILPLGEGGGAGNLIICRIVLMHIAEEVLNDKGRIDPHKIDLMGRMGRFYYVRGPAATAVEEIVQEVTRIGIGFDGLPHGIRHSKILTGNHLGQLASLPALPSARMTRWPWRPPTPRVQQMLAKPRIAPAREALASIFAREALDDQDEGSGRNWPQSWPFCLKTSLIASKLHCILLIRRIFRKKRRAFSGIDGIVDYLLRIRRLYPRSSGP